MTKVRTIVRDRRALRRRRCPCGASATSSTTTSATAATAAGSRPPVNSAVIDTLVTEPMVISTRLGGMVSDIALERRQQRRQLARMRAAASHLGEQHRRHRGHVGRLRAGDAGHQIHRAEQHVRQPAAHVADQGGEERHHHPRDAGHLHQQAEEHEHRHRQQQQVGHALVHPVHHDRQRHGAGQAEIRQRGDAEREGDRHADADAGGDDDDEEHDQAAEAHRQQHWLRRSTAAPRCRRRSPAPGRSCAMWWSRAGAAAR